MMAANPTRATKIQLCPLPRICELSAARWIVMIVL